MGRPTTGPASAGGLFGGSVRDPRTPSLAERLTFSSVPGALPARTLASLGGRAISAVTGQPFTTERAFATDVGNRREGFSSVLGGPGVSGIDIQGINTARASTGLAPLTFQQAAAAPTAAPAAPTLTPEEQRQQRILANIDALRGRVSGASSSLLRAGLGSLQAQRDVSVGTVRSELARRGVLGSSFGQATVNAANADFAQAEAQFRSSVEAQELEATRQILAFEADVINQQISQELAELDISNRFELGLQQIANLNAQLRLQSEIERSRGLGALIGGIGGFVAERLFPPSINVGSGLGLFGRA